MNQDSSLYMTEAKKTINIFSLEIDFRIFLIVCLSLLAICVFFVIYTVINRILLEKRLKDKNIKIRSKRKKEYTFFRKILQAFDKEELHLRFIHSGGVMAITTIEMYFLYRVLFVVAGLILGIELYNPNNISQSVLVVILCGLLGYLVVDFILYQGKKKRTKAIKEQLPMFLTSFDNYTKAGLLFDDIIDVMPKLLQGPLQEELVRFNVSYSLSKDFEGTMKEFIKRLGIIEAEELELKMRQCYYSGIYDDVLINEKELIERKVVNDMRKESEMYDLYLVLAMALMILNIFILVIVPLINVASEGMKFITGG